MNSWPGYYCLIQFCPDRSRLESANVGVVLFCPELDFFDVQLSEDCKRLQRFFGKNSFDPERVASAQQALAYRLRSASESLRSLEAINDFIQSRANALLLSAPRPMKVSRPDEDLAGLFAALVEDKPKRVGSSKLVFPDLDKAFKELASIGLAKLGQAVPLPLLGKSLKFPYAYRNGEMNLVKPKRFSKDENRATNAAMRLALEGDQIARHGAEADGVKKQVVIVAAFEDAHSASALKDRVVNVLEDYHVKAVPQAKLPGFIEQIRREAHEV